MNELQIKKRLIAEATLRDIQEIDDNDVARLDEYITLNYAKNGKIYYWYLDCDGVEVVSDINGNIIKVDNTMDCFGIL